MRWLICACSVAFFGVTLWCFVIPIGRHDWAIAVRADEWRFSPYGVTMEYSSVTRRTHRIRGARTALHRHTPTTSHLFWDWPLSTRWETAVRPLVGDHIHMDASIWVNGPPARPSRARPRPHRIRTLRTQIRRVHPTRRYRLHEIMAARGRAHPL